MLTIQIRTEIPGPRSRALMARREAAVPRGPYNSAPIFMASAEGSTLEDVDGNRYLDFAGGALGLYGGHPVPGGWSGLWGGGRERALLRVAGAAYRHNDRRGRKA